MKYNKHGQGTHSTLEEGYDFFVTDRYNKKYLFFQNPVGFFNWRSNITIFALFLFA